MENKIEKVLMPMVKSISELSANGIIGIIYFYKKGECSCCFGPENKSEKRFTIQGNTPKNSGMFKKNGTTNEWKLTYTLNKEEAYTVYKVFSKNLRGSGYGIKWAEKNISYAMFIEEIKK